MRTQSKIEYLKDINVDKLLSEIESFKRQVKSLMSLNLKNILQKEFKNYIPFDFLKFMYAVGAQPNLERPLNIFVTIPVTTTTSKRSFNKLKFIKTYLQGTMRQK